jgi:hypothetical protein
MHNPPKEVDFTRRSSGALGQRALPESLAAQARDGWPSRPHISEKIDKREKTTASVVLDCGADWFRLAG